MLQIGAALFYFKLGQTLLQIGAVSLLQIRASVVANWGSYYKLGQPLLQNRAALFIYFIYLFIYSLFIVDSFTIEHIHT